MKIKKFLAAFGNSVIMKMLGILFLTGVVSIFSVMFFFKQQFEMGFKEVFDSNLQNYMQYIVEDIGAPPDTLRAKEISENYLLRIGYERDDYNWATENNFFRVKDSLENLHGGNKHAWIKHRYISHYNQDGSVFYFQPRFDNLNKFHQQMLVSLLFLLLAIFGIHFLLMRVVLKPLKKIDSAVKAVGMGKLDVRIPVKGRDEFAKVSESFNDMTRRIMEMIKAQEQLLVDVSHELRSPLTRVKLALEMMEDSEKKESIASDLMEMEFMIKEIMEEARLKNGHGRLQYTNVNLTEIIKQVTSEFENRKPGIFLKDLPETAEIELDIERIKTVMRNILENALKYSTESIHPVKVEIRKKEKNWQICVTDYGPGVPEKEIPHLFEPFYRVDRSRSKETGGYGLGLSLCKRIIDAHKGKIKVNNNHISGLTVTIELPFQREI